MSTIGTEKFFPTKLDYSTNLSPLDVLVYDGSHDDYSMICGGIHGSQFDIHQTIKQAFVTLMNPNASIKWHKEITTRKNGNFYGSLWVVGCGFSLNDQIIALTETQTYNSPGISQMTLLTIRIDNGGIVKSN